MVFFSYLVQPFPKVDLSLISRIVTHFWLSHKSAKTDPVFLFYAPDIMVCCLDRLFERNNRGFHGLTTVHQTRLPKFQKNRLHKK